QGQRIDGGTQANRQGQSGVGKGGHQHQIEELGNDQDGNGDAYGSADILAGVKAGGQNLDGQQANQTNRIGPHCQLGLGNVSGGKRTVVKQGGDQTVRQQGHAQGSRQAQ